MRGLGDWPVVTEFGADAVWAVYEAVMLPGASSVAGNDPDDRLPKISCIDLSTLRVTTYPILADPRCPSCREDASAPPPLRLRGRLKPDPLGYRLTCAEDHALPSTALVNPACGALSAGTV